MTVASWIDWNHDAEERERLLGGPTPDEAHQLLHNDYVWLERVGVIWRPLDRVLRRARFTHEASFETRQGAGAAA